MIRSQVLSPLKTSLIKYVKDIWYSLSLAVCMIATYGYFLTHYAVSIDDLSSDRYYFGELFAQGRFTNTIIHHLFGFIDNSPWVRDFFGLLLLASSAIVFCIIFDKYTTFKTRYPKIVFSCLLVSAPIFTELFSFNGTCLSIGSGFLCLALSLYTIQISHETRNYKLLFVPVLLLAAVVSWYEALIVVYVDAVFALLILQYIQSKDTVKFKEIVLTGLYFALPLIVAIVIEFAFQTIVFLVFDIERSHNAPNTIAWFSGKKFDFIGMIKSILVSYFACGLWNKTIAIFLISLLGSIALCIYYCKKRKSFIPIFLFGCLILTNFVLSILIGKAMSYRMCQSFAFFTAFIMLLLLLLIENRHASAGKTVKRIFCSLAAYLIIIQISTSNYWYFWEYQRYREEESVIKQVSAMLVADYDISKPIVFTGEYELSENILDHSYATVDSFGYQMLDKINNSLNLGVLEEPTSKYVDRSPQTALFPYITWSITAFEGNSTELFKFLRFHGIDYLKQGTAEMFEEAKELAKDMPKWPQQGSIHDVGDYIIVNF